MPDPDGRDVEVLRLLAELGHQPVSFGVTKLGQPPHPLYLKADQPLTPFTP